MKEKKKLSASLEDYLEAIFHVVAEKQAARARDLALRLKVNNSSVTGALRALSEKGYINYAPYDLITLTKEGREKALDVVRRHEALKDFFVKILGIDNADAEETACEMEHSVSTAVIDKVIQFVEYADICPRVGHDIAEILGSRCKADTPYANCEQCVEKCLDDLNKKKLDAGFGTGKELLLSDVKVGQKVRVQKIKGRGAPQKHIAELGVKPGIIFELEDISAEDASLGIKMKGYHITISAHEASKVVVQLF